MFAVQGCYLRLFQSFLVVLVQDSLDESQSEFLMFHCDFSPCDLHQFMLESTLKNKVGIR